MSKSALRKTIIAAVFMSFSLMTSANICLVLGDSQTAVSLEKKKGLATSLRDELQKRGISPVFYALKGAKAETWTENNPKLDFIAQKSTDGQWTPYQASLAESGREQTLILKSDKGSFLDQIKNFHTDDQVDCLIFQIGDAELFNTEGPKQTANLVAKAKILFPQAKTCGVLSPSIKGMKDDSYPFIKNTNKQNYSNRLKYHMDQKGLNESCPILDTITEEFKRKIEDLDQKITFDGLIYNDFGSKLWVVEALKQHPLL